MNKKLLKILACPECKHSVEYDAGANELVCGQCRLAFPVVDDVPVMLLDEARQLEVGSTNAG